MVLARVYPIVLGLDRLETASFSRSNGAFPYLTGLPGFPDPQTLRLFLLGAPESLWGRLHRVNERVLQDFIHLPEGRWRLTLDLDSTVVTVLGRQEQAAVGYHPCYRGKRSYNPLLCLEANSSYLWDTELRAGVDPRIRELREDFCLRKIPAASFAANALYLEVIRLAYSLVTAFQRTCLHPFWQDLTLQKLRYRLFLLPGQVTRPQNRPALRLKQSAFVEELSTHILSRVAKFKPLQA